MRRSVCISLLIITVGICLLALPAPSHSVAAVPARSVANRPTPPVLGPVIKGFAPPAEKWLPGSRGVEFAASVGEPVTTVTAGVVVFAGQVAGAGVVSILLADGRRTTHMPVVPSVAVGQVVVPGQQIGVVGDGATMHPHLFALGVEEGRCLSKPHDIVATSGAVAALGQSASFSVGARMACAAPEPARGQQEESCLKRCPHASVAWSWAGRRVRH